MVVPRRVFAATAALVLALLGLVGATGPVASAAPGPERLSWRLTPTGSAERLRGLSAVSGRVAWASGTGGTVLRTTDAGRTWQSVGPPGTATLQFRDITATSSQHAVAMSAGTGTDSRIYVTDDGGAMWTEAFRNTEPTAFYDCMAFTTRQRGLALSDPVGGRFRLVETSDGGHTWSLVDPSGMPPALPGEFAFAASGTCLSAGVGQNLYIGSGGVDPARVFTSHDRGYTWTVTNAAIAGGPTAGVFSVRFRDRNTGIAVGGDYANPAGSAGTAAYSTDGGSSWQPAAATPSGYRSGSSWLPSSRSTAVAVGPSGSDVTRDAGRTWSPFDTGSFDSVECASDGACWASGEQGRVARLVVRDDRR